MTVPSLVNVVAISSVVLNGLFNSIFVVHDVYYASGCRRNGVNNTEGKANFFLGQVTQVLTSLAMGVSL